MLKVRFFSIEGISTREELFDAIDLEELLAEVCRKYGHISRETLHDCIVLVNGRSTAADNGKNISFRDGDEVQLLAPIVGG